MKKMIPFLLLVMAVAAFWGCTGVDNLLKRQNANDYIQKGQQLEDEGKLLEALEQYKLALTISPGHGEAMAKKDGLEKKIHQAAQTHYKSGLRLYRRGQYKLARNEFLKTLRYQPDHSGALEMIKPRERIEAKRYVTHTVQPSESLSKIAIRYYGDYKKFPLIAQYNNIADATKVVPGDVIKVPEIEGVPFLVDNKVIETEKSKEDVPPTAEVFSEESDAELPETESAPEVETASGMEAGSMEDMTPDVTGALQYRDLGIELYNNKAYKEAIVEFEKVLNVYPEDETTLNYLHRCHLQPAMVLYQKGDYLIAKKEFEAALKYNKDCDKCKEYSKKSELAYKETHYNKGISYFANEQLKEAIDEWEKVAKIDPNYKAVQDNIKKANRFLKKLEEIQKSTQ